MKKTMLFNSLLLVIVSIFSSCVDADNSKYKYYKPEPAIKNQGLPFKTSLFMDDIIDNRDPEIHRFSSDPNSNLLIIIPLFPYAHTVTTPIPRHTYFEAGTRLAFTHLIYSDLCQSGLFENVAMPLFTPESANIKSNTGHSIPTDSYVLQITMNEAQWSRYLTCYGLSYPGTFLWAFGFPVSYGTVSVKLQVELYRPGDMKKPIAETQIYEEISCTEFIYDQINYLPPKSEYRLTEIFPKITSRLRDFIFTSVSKYEASGK